MRFMEWLRASGARNKRMRASWEHAERKEGNSLTESQNDCNTELLKAFEGSNITKCQTVEGSSEKYIVGTLPKSVAKYWIYEDGAQVGRRILERWDYDNPQALINDFLKYSKAIEESNYANSRSLNAPADGHVRQKRKHRVRS
jgi:hypothetical protein